MFKERHITNETVDPPHPRPSLLLFLNPKSWDGIDESWLQAEEL